MARGAQTVRGEVRIAALARVLRAAPTSGRAHGRKLRVAAAVRREQLSNLGHGFGGEREEGGSVKCEGRGCMESRIESGFKQPAIGASSRQA